MVVIRRLVIVPFVLLAAMILIPMVLLAIALNVFEPRTERPRRRRVWSEVEFSRN